MRTILILAAALLAGCAEDEIIETNPHAVVDCGGDNTGEQCEFGCASGTFLGAGNVRSCEASFVIRRDDDPEEIPGHATCSDFSVVHFGGEFDFDTGSYVGGVDGCCVGPLAIAPLLRYFAECDVQNVSDGGD